ncbi:MAG TPA: SDR family oxidoreductase [Polyangia bacterium]|nr:SDR family oxidoreductase [Polyangia bacterium]
MEERAAGKLRGKIAVITGGTSGIGMATARRFAEEGATLVVTGASEAGVAAGRDALGSAAEVVRCDAGDAAESERLFQAIGRDHGGIDVLFLNAGIVRNGRLADLDASVFDEVMRVNVKGTFLALKHAARLLRAGGAVVVNTSVANRLGVPGGGVYAASKAALRSLVRTAAAELLEQNVRVNAISPGPTDTPVYGKQGLPPAAVPEVRRRLAAMVPQHRLAAPEEIARAVLFLASADASFMTGEELAVNGGLSAF